MAVQTTIWFDVVTALLAALRADAGVLAALGTTGRIVDGPILLDAAASVMLIIGGTAIDPDGTEPVGDFAQSWAESGARARHEAATVVNELVVRDGSTDMPTVRATAQAVLSAIESMLRANWSLGLGRTLWVHITDGQVRERQTATGASISVVFTIAARARLASQ